MPDTQAAPVVIESPESEPARRFLLDPDTSYEITCPECLGIVSVSIGAVFPAGSGTGTEISGDPVLGHLIDAANDHVCYPEDGNG
jgi:hypothetical protein